MNSEIQHQQTESLLEISRGLRNHAQHDDDTPGNVSQIVLHPFRVLSLFRKTSGGVAALNPRLISRTPSACLCVIALLCFVSNASASDPSPFATAQPIALGDARWTSGFWGNRFELCRTQMIPSMERLMEGTNYTHFFRNFEIAAGLAEGRYRGAPFNDGDFYKWMEAAIATLAVKKNPALEARLDEIIAVIAKAQRADGYIHTPVLVKQRNGDTNALPFSDRNNFEMYNMGHLLTTAVVHHRVTGKTNLLALARKTADFLHDTFNNASPEVARSSVCPSHYMGMIDLYRETREPRYLSLAKKFFELRSQITGGGDDNQDRVPFAQQTNAIGHAVRANYLYAGAADLFMETGDTNLWKPLEPIWRNLTGQKMHITGGCGALYDGASPDGSKNQTSITRVHQAYGRDYQLPNTTAHNETCANIGNVLWNWRMFLATGEARFVDVAELALYNCVLSGVSLDGTNFFYVNPLRTTDPLPTELRWQHQRVPYVSSFCCPPNVLRTIAESAGYAYAKSDDAIWVNLYGASELDTELPNVGKVKLTQETEYPWSGRVRLKVIEATGKEFAIKLRIPGWANGATVRVNHRLVQIPGALASRRRVSESSKLQLAGETPALPGYASLRRAWKAGDVVDLELPMPTELIESNPLVEETLGQVAVKRGPIVYCLESVDLPKGVKPLDVSLSANTKLRARFDQRLLGGVVVLEGTTLARTNANWSGQLYRELKPAKTTPIKLRLIPYSLWANRGESEMSVWLPLNRTDE